MDAPAELVFDLDADVPRMTEWLPTTDVVDEPGPNRIHVAGERGGGRYDAEGLFRAQREQLRIEWGSAGTGVYAGWLQVFSRDGGDCEVTLHLSFLDERDGMYRGDGSSTVETETETALDRLAEQVSAQR